MTDGANPDQTSKSKLYNQAIPLALTVVVFLLLSGAFYLCVYLLDLLPLKDKISLQIRYYDVLIGGTIYLKTSVDFAIFMGRLMASNPGWRNRIAIEIGTAVGNALGTIVVLIIWTFFKEINWLLGLMVLLASLVLFELAFASLEHFESWEGEKGGKRLAYLGMEKPLSALLKIIRPVISKILPDLGEKLKGSEKLPWKKLVYFSFTVPFILGLDDFAGYVPLFSVVNVLGFSIGVIGAHTILNIALFISPEKTVKAVRNEWVSFLGALAFVGLGIWGLIEVYKIFFIH